MVLTRFDPAVRDESLTCRSAISFNAGSRTQDFEDPFQAKAHSASQRLAEHQQTPVSRSNRLTRLGYMMVTAKIMDIATEGPLADSAGDQNKPLLQIFRRGNARFAVLADEVAAIAEWRQPTPLPQAPPAVLGVVAVQGRILTVLDPAILLDEPADGRSTNNLIVALRGDEQLALLVDEKGETVPAGVGLQSAATTGAMRGYIKHQENEIGVLDRTKLFGLAIRGRERRQRRF